MRIREDSVEYEEDARVRMLRAAVEKSVAPSQYMKSLLLDVITASSLVELGLEG